MSPDRTTVLPLAEAGAEAFNGDQSDFQVLVTGGGTGVGIKNIAEGNSDIGMASREITGYEKSQFGDQFEENLLGYDGIVIAVSKKTGLRHRGHRSTKTSWVPNQLRLLA